jgi:putative heme-binding domain-containing protein
MMLSRCKPKLIPVVGSLLLLFSVVPSSHLVRGEDGVQGTDDSTGTVRLVDVVGAQEPDTPDSWYGEGVRPSEARTPEQELAGFHLPPGFEIRLFAAEPQIAKPLNIAPDAVGRLWVTNTFEYPYPAGPGEPRRDSIRILEDLDGDGLADSSTVFADQLNIPMGVLPYGEGCLCFDIPNIYYLRDTDGDLVCDRRDKILGPFDTSRDTHGMINALRFGPDGWIYANHGFNNQTRVAGRDGHAITMNSGNTFRFRPDGQRIEHVTWGQVNPFGRTSDDWGYDYSADCHSKPISQLIRDGYYPSFGKPDDGLGFIPPMMDHLHGSTAISGLVYISPTMGIPALSDQMLSGNVMTSRINRNRVLYQGATATAAQLPDFLTSDDPWFRPVDIRLGPDGFLYVADFYNRIIGHYEVPLDHPGRDRFRGRIWQIRPVGSKPTATTNWSPASAVERWNHANPTVRRLALQWSVEHADASLDQAARELLESSDIESQSGRINAMWYAHQRDWLDLPILTRLAADPSPQVRTHLFRALRDADKSSSLATQPIADLAAAAIDDPSPHVRRAAAEALGVVGRPRALRPLLTALAGTDPTDPILRQTIRIALRNLLVTFPSATPAEFGFDALTTDLRRELADIMLAVPTQTSAGFLIRYLSDPETASDPRSDQMVEHLVRHADADQMVAAIRLARESTGDDPSRQRQIIDRIVAGVGVQKSNDTSALRSWISDLTAQEFELAKQQLSGGTPVIAWEGTNGQAWPTQTRMTADNSPVEVVSSFPLGESYVGAFESETFAAPPTIEFLLAGHNGEPSTADTQKNRMLLIDSETGKVLHTALPPRSDTLVVTRWDCGPFVGRPVKIRCEDSDPGNAYAWLAFGRLAPIWLNPATGNSAVDRYIDLVTTYRLDAERERLAGLIQTVAGQRSLQSRLAGTIATLDQNYLLADLLTLAGEQGVREELNQRLITAAVDRSPIDAVEETAQLATHLSSEGQLQLALLLAEKQQTSTVLLRVIDRGSLSPNVLLAKNVWDRVTATGEASQMDDAERLRGLAKPVDAELETAMNEIRRLMASGSHDLEQGRLLFEKNCAICHKIADRGQLVGPQLDGVGSRGPDRLLEDIMQPDRNVDKAFRTTTFLTDSGTVISGLVRHEDADSIEIVGQDGKSIRLDPQSVDVRREGTTSLMPGNLQQTIGNDGVASIVHYVMVTASQQPPQRDSAPASE